MCCLSHPTMVFCYGSQRETDKPSQYLPTQGEVHTERLLRAQLSTASSSNSTLFSGSWSWPQHPRLQWQLILWPPSEFSISCSTNGAKASWVCHGFAGTMLVFLALQTLIPITAQGNQCCGICQLVVWWMKCKGLCTGLWTVVITWSMFTWEDY